MSLWPTGGMRLCSRKCNKGLKQVFGFHCAKHKPFACTLGLDQSEPRSLSLQLGLLTRRALAARPLAAAAHTEHRPQCPSSSLGPHCPLQAHPRLEPSRFQEPAHTTGAGAYRPPAVQALEFGEAVKLQRCTARMLLRAAAPRERSPRTNASTISRASTAKRKYSPFHCKDSLSNSARFLTRSAGVQRSTVHGDRRGRRATSCTRRWTEDGTPCNTTRHPRHVHARAKAGHGADQNVDFLVEKPGWIAVAASSRPP